MPAPTPSTTPTPSGNVLPLDSTLVFVLDDPISSGSSKAGQEIHVHLKSAIVVGGRTVAPAGTQGLIRITDSSGADIMDVYGFVDIFFEPLKLPDGRLLPLRAPFARLEPRVSSGHESTVGAEDTVGDIFVPYYAFWQILRKGKNFVLKPGAEIPARTQAIVEKAPNGSIAIVTPAPLLPRDEVPNATFPVIPVATPLDTAAPSRARPLPSPSPSPTASPTPSP
ncbi:MAG: hypothetical protein JO078_09445 [Candidatus Eremiobacteraeota bacterium]|nr:hypothetical protein [Candidatus Eremiobacteraeota bacterium]MBV9700335.1 hypothetical protein [Candidatus Eremiobacteraeota bacterium]